jgi:acyl dehydratase
VNGIQHVRFPHPVQACQTIKTRREVQSLTLIIFEIGQFEP